MYKPFAEGDVVKAVKTHMDPIIIVGGPKAPFEGLTVGQEVGRKPAKNPSFSIESPSEGAPPINVLCEAFGKTEPVGWAVYTVDTIIDPMAESSAVVMETT